MSKKDLLPPEFVDVAGEPISPRELKGIGKALAEHKRDVLKLHKMPMSADCALEIIHLEKSFRKAITSDILALVELNCANCPMGFTKEDCKAKSCPFKTLDQLLKSRLRELDQVLPGGV